MRRLFIGLIAAASTIALTQIASAADMPVKAPRYAPPPPPPPYNWTGFYAGGNIGYSWGHADGSYTEEAFPAPFQTLSGSTSADGIIGGGQIGYNWQVNNVWLLGIEADFQGSGEKGSFTNGFPEEGECAGGCKVTHIQETKLSWFGTVRGRIGVLINPTLLLYGTGGLAYGRIKVSGNLNDTTCGPACPWSYGNSTTKTGWTAGAGIEGAILNTRDWTWKIEYLYMDLGTVSGNGFDTDFSSPFTWNSKFTDNILRFGVNYRFWN
jgi:outer membrane immunogenic protein